MASIGTVQIAMGCCVVQAFVALPCPPCFPLDKMGFLRHFLHLFHRIRANYLSAYQNLVLNEPDSAVSQTLKEAFLALRQAAENGE